MPENEIGQLREWDEGREQDWDLRRFPAHDSFNRYVVELNGLYLDHPALWERDYEPDGFAWLECDDPGRCVYAFERRGGGERLVAVFNLGAGRSSTCRLRPGRVSSSTRTGSATAAGPAKRENVPSPWMAPSG